MDLIDQLRTLSNRIPHLTGLTKTEEATKHSMVLPFIRALGYDPFDPSEVVPEFIADVGIKKGEKIDYAIMRGILREAVDPKRVGMRDAQSYCAVLLDDNNRKPVVRMYLPAGGKKQLGFFDAEKKEERVAITELQDIFKYADRLKTTLGYYTAAAK